jgi:tyrosine-protein kinase Etk/Wzc
MVAATKRALRSGLGDPGDIERVSMLPVYATIGTSRTQRRRRARGNGGTPALPLVARDAPADPSVDALRHFRAALLYAAPLSKNNIVLFASPTAGSGTSFVVANLAFLLGVAKLRILLVDGNFRRGSLHRYFGISAVPGLAEALSEPAGIPGVVQCQVAPNVDLITCGIAAAGPDSLLLPGLPAMLAELAPQYDLVLIDSGPVLETSDALTLGKYAGALYVVTRAFGTTTSELTDTIRILERSGLSATGCILNSVPKADRHSTKQYQAGPGWNIPYVLARPANESTQFRKAARE